MALGFEVATELSVVLSERACDGELDGASLSWDTASVDGNDDIELVYEIRSLKGSQDLVLKRHGGEVVFEDAIVDFDVASSGSEGDASDGGLASSGGSECCFSSGGHDERECLKSGSSYAIS